MLELNKEEFLKTEFGSTLKECITAWDHWLAKLKEFRFDPSGQEYRTASHRSYRNNVATAEHFQNRQVLKVSQQNVMKEKGNLFTKLMGLFKKGDK